MLRLLICIFIAVLGWFLRKKDNLIGTTLLWVGLVGAACVLLPWLGGVLVVLLLLGGAGFVVDICSKR